MDCIGDCLCGADIAYHAAHICRQPAAWNLTLHHTLDEHLLSALGVFCPGRNHLKLRDIRRLGLQQFDGVRLIVLDNDDAFLRAYGFDYGLKAENYVVRKF